MSDDEQNKINKQGAIDRVMLLYSKQGYFNLYGPTIIYFIFMIFVLFLVISFTKAMMNIKYLSDNWETERCSPSVMPFAGLINSARNCYDILDRPKSDYSAIFRNDTQ